MSYIGNKCKKSLTNLLGQTAQAESWFGPSDRHKALIKGMKRMQLKNSGPVFSFSFDPVIFMVSVGGQCTLQKSLYKRVILNLPYLHLTIQLFFVF